MSSSFFPDGRRAALSLSFDDARPSQADCGIPILQAQGVAATFYVSTHMLDQRLDGWRQAALAGHEIGNHTLNHPCSGNFPWYRSDALKESLRAQASGRRPRFRPRTLESYTLAQMEAELTGANETIHRLLGVRPTTFAYPCGQTFVGRGTDHASYVPLVARHFLAGRCFRSEATNDPTYCDLAHLGAFDGDERDFQTLKQFVDEAIEQGSWLILACHEIGQPAHQTTRAADLEALCSYCHQRKNELWVDTVNSIASFIRRERGE